MEKVTIARIKWGISRGRDTYGYNVCTLYVDGRRVASCNGGGYDLEDTCFSDWINREFQGRIDAYCRGKKKVPYSETMPGSKKLADQWKDGHFFLHGKGGHWRLDGGNGCAIDSARKIGVEIKETLEHKRGRGLCGTGIYIITDKKAAV